MNSKDTNYNKNIPKVGVWEARLFICEISETM